MNPLKTAYPYDQSYPLSLGLSSHALHLVCALYPFSFIVTVALRHMTKFSILQISHNIAGSELDYSATASSANLVHLRQKHTLFVLDYEY